MSPKQTPPAVCFYFQVHQPYRLKDLRISDIGNLNHADYFDHDKNKAVFRKVAEKCYLPANATMLKLLESNDEFRIAYSLSGVFLDQCREYGPDVLASFKALADTGRVEFLAETYYHSLAALFSPVEFCEQVERHTDSIEELFGVRPTVFRNTELIYSNEIAETVRLLGFRGILSEGVDRILNGRSASIVYQPPSFRLNEERARMIKKHRIHPKSTRTIKLLLKNYQLSDDIAFRFGQSSRSATPLTADTFAEWVRVSKGDSINLFMDYETFGEHQWEDTGIFQFLAALPDAFAKRGITTLMPSELVSLSAFRKCPILDVHAPVSWADTERDLSAWRGNNLQEAAFAGIYALEAAVRAVKDPAVLDTWRKLQTSDHFYYLCTKYWNDGDVHKYFSPYESPYEAYRRFSHALEGLRMYLEKIKFHPLPS